ncbi:bacterial proteasome activator family protein [Cellulomonas massiliensis]|uniref:bacterial proteasome activator family protein n=1 Tax=Cellulomonas massiliensis TaxID=1465811 RepID=UPI000313F6CB|nr:bacterial proteasome activator family protein [Cellulomonas massiliensis]
MTDSSERPGPEQDEQREQAEQTRAPRVVVLGDETATDDDQGPQDEGVGSLVNQPAKVMRIGTMIKQLLDEVRSAPLDDRARARLAEVHERSLAELEEGLSPELVEELHRITLPFVDDGDTPPSDAELRIAQAQLVGWLEGLFHGIQTALVAQQMAAQAQLSQMRRALPPGPGGRPGLVVPGAAVEPGEEHPPGTGQYL